MNDTHDFTDGAATAEDQRPIIEGDLEGADEATVFDAFSKAVKVDVSLKEFLLPVPLRAEEGISLVVDPKFEFDDLMRWVKASADKRKGRQAPARPRYMANILLSHTVKGVAVRGQEVKFDGERMPLTDKRLWEMLAQGRTNNGIPVIYDVASCLIVIFGEGADGHIIGAMNEVIDKAGYGEIDWEDDSSTPLP